LQQRADAPTVRGTPLTAQIATPVRSTAAVAASDAVQAPREAISYTVPPAVPSAIPPARLTNYVFAHSRYSSGLALRGVMADLLIESDEPQQPAVNEAAAHVPP
jgi:hypothetical protein